MRPEQRSPTETRSRVGSRNQAQRFTEEEAEFPKQMNFDPYAANQNDRFGESDLIRAMKQCDRAAFCALYNAQAAQSRVNCFMYAVFIKGRAWHPTLKEPEYALDKDSSGKTLLHYAAVGGVNLSEGYFKNFILPRTVGKQDSRGSTALMLAAAAGNANSVVVLKEFECGIVDADGCSALMYASKFARKRCVELLIPEEHYIRDSRGFVFTDYLPQDIGDDFHKMIAIKTTSVSKAAGPLKTMEQGDSDQMQALPPFEEMESKFRADLHQMQISIEQRIQESIELQRDVTAEPVIRIEDQFRRYLEENAFPKVEQELSEFLAVHSPRGSNEINRTAAAEMVSRVHEFRGNLFSRLEEEQQRALQIFSHEIEKIHLVLLYKQNDLHDDFDAIFSKLQSAEEIRNAQLQECVKTVNQIAYGNVRFSRAKELCIRSATDFQQFGDQLYETLHTVFRTTLEKEHDYLDAKITKEAEIVSSGFLEKLKAQFAAAERKIVDRTMIKIDENILIRINQAIKKIDAFATSQIPDIAQIKNHINCIVVMIRNSRKIVSYYFYTAIYGLAAEFIATETGLFEFVAEQGILPIENVIPNYAFITEYFAVFHKQFQFTADQLIQAMVHELALEFSPALEKEFVMFLEKYFMANRGNDIPRIVCARHGTLKKERVHIADQLGEDLEVGFAYFYLSVIAEISKCEMVCYQEIDDITASQLLEDEQYVGTYRIFQPAKGKSYRCASPGWMYMDERNDIDIIVEPEFECTEDI